MSAIVATSLIKAGSMGADTNKTKAETNTTSSTPTVTKTELVESKGIKAKVKAETKKTDSNSFDLNDFVKNKLIRNKSVKVLNIRKVGEKPLKGHGEWKAYLLLIDTQIGKRKQTFPEIIFVNAKDSLVTMSLLDGKSGDDIGRNLKPAMPESYYDKEHLILGKADAPNKIVVFSDPQCPFCKSYIPKLKKDVEKNPDKLAVYYYHMPLTRIHPASKTIVKVMEYLQKQGKVEDALKLYYLRVNPREKREKKILKAINKQFGLNISQKDINTPEIKKALEDDMQKAIDMMVKGTPTVFFNGKFDRSRVKYRDVLK